MTKLTTTYKTRQMFDVEQTNGGRDIRLVLIDFYNALGSQAAIAEKLGVTQPTIANWFEMLGIVVETKTIARLKEPELVAA